MEHIIEDDDDDHLLDRQEEYQSPRKTFSESDLKSERMKEMIWAKRYWILAAFILFLVFNLFLLIFAFSSRSDQVTPVDSQTRDLTFIQLLDGTETDLRIDAEFITQKPHLGILFDFIFLF